MNNRTEPSTRNIKRFPFRLAMMIGNRLVIANPDATGYYLERAFPLGLPVDMAAFIHHYCVCAHCGASISRDLNRCVCGHPKAPKLHLEVECPEEIYYSKFKPILERENSRIKRLNRKKLIEANGGSFSQQDIAALYDIQEGICYFCGNPISKTVDGNNFHIDHYEALYSGGRNDISNIVLTCSSCNLRKGKIHGSDFEYVARKLRSPEIGLKLRKLRKRLNAFVASQVRALKHNGNQDA